MTWFRAQPHLDPDIALTLIRQIPQNFCVYPKLYRTDFASLMLILATLNQTQEPYESTCISGPLRSHPLPVNACFSAIR